MILSNSTRLAFLLLLRFFKILILIVLYILHCLLACLVCYFYHSIFMKILYTQYPQLFFIHFKCCWFQYLQLNFQFANYYFVIKFSIALIIFRHFIIERFSNSNSYLFLIKYFISLKFII